MSENPYEAPRAAVSDPIEAGEVQLATRGKRFLGALVDGLIGLAVGVGLILLMGYWDKIFDQTITVTESLMVAALGFAAFIGIHAYTLSRSEQTLGKVLLRTQIVSVDTNQPIPLGRVIVLRYLPTSVLGQIPLVGMVFGLANPLFIFRSDRRCIHDLFAGTKVIDYRPPSGPM